MADLPNEVFGKMDRCLHCAVWDIINEASPKDREGAPVYLAEEIVGGLTEVLAEIIASHPRPERRALLNHMDREMRRYVSTKVASGNHPQGRPGKSVH